MLDDNIFNRNGIVMKRLSTVFLVFGFVVLSTAFSFGSALDDCGDYENSMKWIQNIHLPDAGPVYSLSVEWPLVYTGNREGFFVTDLSDLENPEVTGLLEVDYSFLEKSGPVGLSRFQFQSIISLDFSDPLHPVIQDTLELDLETWDTIRTIVISGDRAYVAATSKRLFVVDISDLQNLSISGSWLSPENINDVDVCGNIAYVGDWKSLHILDLTDPDNPQEIGAKYSPRLKVERNGDLLLAANNFNFEVFRLNDPAHPESIFKSSNPFMEECAVNEDVAALGYFTTSIFPLKQLASQQDVVTVGNDGYTPGPMTIHDGMLIKASGDILELYDLQEGRSVKGGPIKYMDYGVHDWALQGDFLFGANWEPGFVVCTIDDDGEIEVVVESDEFGHLNQVEIVGDLAFVSGALFWQILDISDPLNPTALTQPWTLPDGPEQLFIHNEQLVLIAPGWAKIYDISDLDNIQLSSTTDLDYWLSAEMDGELLYLGGGYGNYGVDIYSTSSGDLQYQGSLDLPNDAMDLAVKDGLLMASVGTYSHQFFDVSDIGNPLFVSESITWTAGKAHFVDDGVLINDDYSLRFYNTDDSLSLDILGSFWFKGMQDFQVMPNGRILVWGGGKMQVAVPPCCWTDPSLKQQSELKPVITVSPNPFNPQTTLEFHLPRPGFCSLEIYDLRGRLVESLWAGNRGAGDQYFLWQGRDEEGKAVPSGVYFARLVYEGAVENRKIVLLK